MSDERKEISRLNELLNQRNRKLYNRDKENYEFLEKVKFIYETKISDLEQEMHRLKQDNTRLNTMATPENVFDNVYILTKENKLKIAQLEEMIENLNQQLNEKEKQSNEFQLEIHRLKEDNARLCTIKIPENVVDNGDSLTNENKLKIAHEEMINNLTKQLNEKNKQIDELNELKQYNTKLSTMAVQENSSPAFSLNKVGIEKWRCYEEVKKENETLKMQLTANEVIINSSKCLTEKKNDLEKEKISLLEQIEKKNTEILLLKEEIENCKIEIKQYKNDIEQKVNEKKSMKDEFETVSKNLKEKEDQLEKEKISLLEQIEQKNTEFSLLEKEIENFKIEIKQCKDHIEQEVNEKKSLKIEFETVSKNLKEKEDQLAKQTEISKKLKQSCLTVSKQAEDLEQLYAKLDTEKNKINNEHQLTIECNEKLEENLKNMKNEFEKEREKHVEIVRSFEMELAKYCEDLKMRIQTCENLRVMYDNEVQIRTECELNLKSMEESLSDQDEMIQSLKSQSERSSEELCLIKEELALQKTINDNLECKNEELFRALEETQRSYDYLLKEYVQKSEQHEQENFQLTTKLKQHSKLLDFVLSKNQTPKKCQNKSVKSFFGSPRSIRKNKRENEEKTMEIELTNERTKNQKLIEEIKETKKELQNCLSKILFYESSYGPFNEIKSQKNVNNQQSSIEENNDFKLYSSSPSAPSIENFSSRSSNCSTTDNNESEASCKEASTSFVFHKHKEPENLDFTFSNSVIEELEHENK